ncbi:hypothetical protein CDIK_2239 [Cucumispora dikerogammari]|nr:hypothetical protein CDIK_2239 [Cucumispora dikerogammari]
MAMCNFVDHVKKIACREDSIFEELKTSLLKVFRSIHRFCKKSLQNDTLYDPDKSKNTVSAWFKIIQRIMQDLLINNPKRIEGLDTNENRKVVEINDFFF